MAESQALLFADGFDSNWQSASETVRQGLPITQNPIYFASAAGVVELVDTRDSKFRELCSCRFESDLRYHLLPVQAFLLQ